MTDYETKNCDRQQAEVAFCLDRSGFTGPVTFDDIWESSSCSSVSFEFEYLPPKYIFKFESEEIFRVPKKNLARKGRREIFFGWVRKIRRGRGRRGSF